MRRMKEDEAPKTHAVVGITNNVNVPVVPRTKRGESRDGFSLNKNHPRKKKGR
jgi:hypothetical protein